MLFPHTAARAKQALTTDNGGGHGRDIHAIAFRCSAVCYVALLVSLGMQVCRVSTPNPCTRVPSRPGTSGTGSMCVATEPRTPYDQARVQTHGKQRSGSRSAVLLAALGKGVSAVELVDPGFLIALSHLRGY